MKTAVRHSDILGTLYATITNDGDVSLRIESPPDGGSIQFCTGLGGGRSPKVLRALRALVDAMQEENTDGRYPSLGYNC